MANPVQTRSPFRRTFAWTRDNLPAILLSLTLILFISKSVYNIPVIAMALLGAWRLIRERSALLDDVVIRAYVIAFLLVWIPMLIACFDAVNVERSLRTVLPYLRFLFAGIYVLRSRDRIAVARLVMTVTFFVASFWSIDASIQYLAGKNLVGYPYEPGQITGMFFPRNTIAHVLAAVSPIYLDCLRRYGKRHPWVWALTVPLVVVILISGRRAAWVMLALSFVGYFFYLYKTHEPSVRAKRRLALVGVVVVLASGLVVATNEPVQSRIATTAGLFSLDYETIDNATAKRLPIWETAIAVFRSNWLNGVGPRGFRHVYSQYSDEDDFWYETGTTHPHHLVLEVLAETGSIGLLGLLVFAVALYRFFRGNVHGSELLFPPALAVLVVLFPLNTSMAFYGSYWSSLTWWLIMLAFLAVEDARRAPAQASRAHG